MSFFGDEMSEKILNDITSYIDFLRRTGFLVSISCFNAVLQKHLPTLLKYEVHLPAICSYLKSNEKTYALCLQNKRKLEKKEIKAPYYSCCYAGVEEFVVPIISDDTLICCISVSGYRGLLEKSKQHSQKIKETVGKDFSYHYSHLNKKTPTMKEVLQFTKPLEYMFIELKNECLREADDFSGSSFIYSLALRYIYDNYMNSFTLDDMAKSLNYSTSYLRHTFLKQAGKSINKVLNLVRLSQAKQLLKTTNLSITDIAIECGFCDGNYFSTVFKKEFKLTPKEYRKQKMLS